MVNFAPSGRYCCCNTTAIRPNHCNQPVKRQRCNVSGGVATALVSFSRSVCLVQSSNVNGVDCTDILTDALTYCHHSHSYNKQRLDVCVCLYAVQFILNNCTQAVLSHTLLVFYATKLDGQGKARREAARRRNSECKINLSCRNSSRGNGSRPTAQR